RRKTTLTRAESAGFGGGAPVVQCAAFERGLSERSLVGAGACADRRISEALGRREAGKEGAMSQRWVVGLSQPIDTAIPMFPGLPPPEIVEHLSREASRAHYSGGTEFVIHRYSLIGNSGTYMDAPFHRYADGADLAELPLERTVDLPGL